MFKKSRILMNQVGGDGGDAGGSGQTKGDQGTPPNTPTPQAQGDDRYDQYGYEKTPAEPEVKQQATPDANAAKKSSDETDSKEPLKEAILGYDDKEPEPVKEEIPPPAPEEPLKFAVEVDTKGLKNADLTDLKGLIESHNLSKEQAQALIDLRAKEVQDYNQYVDQRKKDYDKAVTKERQEWTKELKEDKELGGEHYVRTLRRVDKVLNDYFPGVKKLLTERKMVLPPTVMRDLAKFYEHQNSTPKLVPGEPIKAQENPGDPLAFYK